MIPASQKSHFVILFITSLIFSRALFYFIDDPEGPNLLVVTVMAAVIYFPSLLVYRSRALTLTRVRKVLLTITFQVLLATILYFCLH